MGRRYAETTRGAGRCTAAACAPATLPFFLAVVLLALLALLTLVGPAASPVLAASAETPAADASGNPGFSALQPGELPAPPSVSAKSAILVEQDTGHILFSKKANYERPMASTTKIMTAILVLERLSLDEVLTVPLEATGVIGSVAGLRWGETFTVRQLLHALLISSGNDAAITLAVATAGSVEAFVRLMNERAASLGLKHTRFLNPHGLNREGQYSSAYDLAMMTMVAMKNETFRKIVNKSSYVLVRPDGTSLKLKNSNRLVKEVSWVTGVKTGSTPASGACLVSSGSKKGISLIAVVLGEADSDQRFADGKELLEYGFSLYRTVVVVSKNQPVYDVTVPFRPDEPLHVVAAKALTLTAFAEDEVQTAIRKRAVHWPVEAGDRLGTLLVTVAGTQVDTVDLIASGPVERPTLAYYLGRLNGSWPPGLPLARVLQTAMQ